MRLLYPLVLVALLVAGCASPSEVPPDSDGGAAHPPGEEPTRATITVPAPHESIDFSNCEYVELGQFWGPLPTTWDRPPGWRDSIHTYLEYTYYECERFAWKHFERGPVRLMFEAEDLLENGYPCDPLGGVSGLYLVIRTYIDDAEIAVHWADAFHKPVLLTEFNLVESTAGAMMETRLEWSANGSAPSTLAFPHGAPRNSVDETTHRYLFFNDTSMTAMDLDVAFRQADPQGLYGLGHFEDPSPFAGQLADQPVSPNRHTGLNGAGSFTTWNNHECKP